MLQLVIDAGNTLIKGAVFENSQIIERFHTKGKSLADFLLAVSALDQLPQQALISSVRADSDSLYESLTDLGINQVLSFRSGLKLPIKIQYKTPETLGTDRIANACMASAIFPKDNILAIDIGTCIKFDMVTSDQEYLGGSISPGVKIRYKGLSSFTGKLPYFKKMQEEFPELIGTSTEGSIRSGVENGILCEINGMIDAYEQRFDNLKIALTGGDANRFSQLLKKSGIFVEPELTLRGLHLILKTNVEKS